MSVSSPVKFVVRASNAALTVRYPNISVLCMLFQKTHISLDLSAPVDVYAEWVDACDSVAKTDPQEPSSRYSAPQRAQLRQENSRTNEDDGIIDDEDDDHDAGGYGGEDDGVVADDDEY